RPCRPATQSFYLSERTQHTGGDRTSGMECQPAAGPAEALRWLPLCRAGDGGQREQDAEPDGGWPQMSVRRTLVGVRFACVSSRGCHCVIEAAQVLPIFKTHATASV